jgi:DNA-binding transcriptional regulator YiaG
MTITEIRAISGLNKTKFAELYNIPYRTLQDWEAGKRNPPAYVLPLLERVVKMDFGSR